MPQQYQRSQSFKVQALGNRHFASLERHQQYGSPPPHQYHYTTGGQSLLYSAQDQFLTASESEEEFFDDEEEDEDYRNQALMDFPSDADIVSIEQTPKRLTE